MSTLSRLQTWAARQCNGTWQQSFGVVIESTDNPGWWVKVGLTGTSLQHRAFQEVAEGVDVWRFPVAPRWLSCRVEAGTWHGAADAAGLERVLETFHAWSEADDLNAWPSAVSQAG